MAKEQVDKARKVEELGLARKIMDVLSRKADELASSTGRAQQDFRLEPAERLKLLEINNLGLTEGVAAGLLSLFALRRIRSNLIRRLWANQQGGRSSSAASHHPHTPPPPPTPPPSATTNNPFHNNSPFQQANSQFNPPPPLTPPPSSSSAGASTTTPKQSTFSFIFGWILDSLGAFSVMVTVSFLMTDVRTILGKLSTIPLVEGRSTIAREFCPDVVQALAKIRRDDPAAAAIVNDAQTKQLQAVIQFAENCQRRAAYESHLRREKGVGKHYPVDVPPEGVPPDFAIPEGMTMGGSDDGGEDQKDDHQDYDFYDPRQEGSDGWADSFTTDREDDHRRS